MVTTVEPQRRCIHCRHLEAVNQSSGFKEMLQTFRFALVRVCEAFRVDIGH